MRNRDDQRALRYVSAAEGARGVPDWIDGAIRTTVHPDPLKRYDALSEFLTDLNTPNPRFAHGEQAPLAMRDPTLFWKCMSAGLAVVVVVLLMLLLR